MPANLSPEYKDAQDAYRKARDPHERLELLREMLRTIPKHKGTEHLQAEIKTRIKDLTEEIAGPKKGGGARGGPALVVRPEGAGQVAILGPPNAGKSSLHHRLSGSHAPVGPYPFTTKVPLPGMLPYEDIHFQLVDLPPVCADFMEPWMVGAIEHADGALLVIDLEDPECMEHAIVVRRRLEEKRVTLTERNDEAPTTRGSDTSDQTLDDPFRIRLRTLLIANKADRLADPQGELAAFLELSGLHFPAFAVSAEKAEGLDSIGRTLFEMLNVLRVYTKVPGHHAEMGRPYTLRHPATIRDVARLVHRGRAADLKFARLWGSAEFDGQQVSADHPLRDRDVVELHW